MNAKKKKYKTESKEKQRELHAFEQRLGKLEKDNQRLETEKQKRKNDLKDTENKKPKNDLQEKVRAIEKQYKTFIKRKLLVD